MGFPNALFRVDTNFYPPSLHPWLHVLMIALEFRCTVKKNKPDPGLLKQPW